MSDDGAAANRLESLALNLLFCAASVLLLALIGVATRHGQASGGWWTRPALMPGLALGLLVLANAMTLARALADLRTTPPTATERAEAQARIAGWLRPLEFLGYFALYVWSLPHLGYTLATLTFMLGLMLRVGLRSARWLLAGALAALALVAIFRMGLNVWMPAPPFYDLFPDGVRRILTRWF